MHTRPFYPTESAGGRCRVRTNLLFYFQEGGNLPMGSAGSEPIRLPRSWDSPGKNIGVGCHFLLQCMKVKSESEVAQSCPTLSDPMDCRLLGSSSTEFPRQEHWSGVPLPSPPFLPTPSFFFSCFLSLPVIPSLGWLLFPNLHS